MSKSNSKGTQLKINSKVVGGLTSINGIEINADTVDLTALDNTSGYREKAADFKDVGDVTASGFLDGADDGQDECLSLLDSGEAVACSGRSKLFIREPYTFHFTDMMITNFHLPKSTLIMMVAALAGRERILEAYRDAIAHRYLFFSYGDCMLIK